MSSMGMRLLSVSMRASSTQPRAYSPRVVVKVKWLRSSKASEQYTLSPALMTVSTMGRKNLNCPWLAQRVAMSAEDMQLALDVHFLTVIDSWLDTSDTVFPPRLKVCPSWGHSHSEPPNWLQTLMVSVVKAQCCSVHCSRGRRVVLMTVVPEAMYLSSAWMSKYCRAGLLRSSPSTATPNMNRPSGEAVMSTKGGSVAYQVLIEAVMMSLAAVSMPMLAKRMMKTVTTAREVSPPVAVAYSGSPLQRRNWEVVKRSKLRRKRCSCRLALKQVDMAHNQLSPTSQVTMYNGLVVLVHTTVKPHVTTDPSNSCLHLDCVASCTFCYGNGRHPPHITILETMKSAIGKGKSKSIGKSKGKSKAKGKSKGPSKDKGRRAPQPSRPMPKDKGAPLMFPVRQTSFFLYVNARVLFDISGLNAKLKNALIFSFKTGSCRQQKYSVMCHLKPVVSAKSRDYRHALTTGEAIALHQHVFAKHRGLEDVDRQLEEILSVLQQYTLQSRELPYLSHEREAYNKKVGGLMERFRRVQEQRRLTLRQNFGRSDDKIRVKLLRAHIRGLSLQLFLGSVIGVREIEKGQVEVVMEQSYPIMTCSGGLLKKFIGEEAYLEKRLQLMALYGRAKQLSKLNTNYIVCHCCKGIVVEGYWRCRYEPPRVLTPTSTNSPHTHYRHLLAFDYLYQRREPTHQELERELRYFKFYPSHRRLTCQRFTCLECMHPYVHKSTSNPQRYVCGFCTETCQCHTCSLARSLVVNIALLKHLLLRNCQQLGPVEESIRQANWEHLGAVDESTVRSGFTAPVTVDYEEEYQQLYEKCKKMNETMEDIQEMVVRGDSQAELSLAMITPMMRAARNYFAHSQAVAELDVRSEEQRVASLKGNRSNDSWGEGVSNKDKILKDPNTYRKNQAYFVPSSYLSDFRATFDMKDSELSHLTASLLEGFEPADGSTVERAVTIQKMLPYEERDYQLDSALPDKFKIDSELEVIVRELKGRNILHQIKDRYLGVDLNDCALMPASLDLDQYDSDKDSSQFSQDMSFSSRFQKSARNNPDGRGSQDSEEESDHIPVAGVDEVLEVQSRGEEQVSIRQLVRTIYGMARAEHRSRSIPQTKTQNPVGGPDSDSPEVAVLPSKAKKGGKRP